MQRRTQRIVQSRHDQKIHEERKNGNCIICQQHSADERDGADAEFEYHPRGNDEQRAAELRCYHALFLQINLFIQAFQVLFFRVIGL